MSNYILILIFLGIYIISNYICQFSADSYYNNRIKLGKVTPKLYDLSHKYLPDYSDYKIYKIIGDSYVSLFIFILFLSDYKAGIDYITYYIPIILLRCIMINSTILPKNKKCNENYSLIHGCYDKIFSGHFATLFLATFIFYKYNIIKNIYLLFIINLINAFIILSTRSHYTIDLLVSIIVVLLFYTNNIKLDLKI